MGRVIVIEDNPVFADYVCRLLESKDFRTVRASGCNEARKLFAGMGDDDIVLADLRLPDGDGIALLEELRGQGRNNPYIVMTDYDEVPTAVRSMKSGAEDYLPKRLLADSLPPLLKALRKRTERNGPAIHKRQSAAFMEIDRKIRLVAPTGLNVLILGESGTGKEHIAEKIHILSKRAAGPFVSVDCGLLSRELAASDLFGHEKGAFTGAEGRRQGYWEEAAGGTLFLDEIGNLPPEVQRMLLRALESGRYRPTGGSRDKDADVRIVAATNEGLPAAIAERRFRADLYQRLKEYRLRIPPLRECREDILPLADFFRRMANDELDRHVTGFDAEAVKKLLAHPWPGNVRELKSAVQMAVLSASEGIVTADMLDVEAVHENIPDDFDRREHTVNRERILWALRQADGNRRKAAVILGISPTTLYKRMDLYGVDEKQDDRHGWKSVQ